MGTINKIVRIILLPLFCITIIGILIFYFRIPLENIFTRLKNQYLPCRQPITYTVNLFDERFGLSREQFEKMIYEAEQIWEKSISKDLFTNIPDGKLKINLIYDDRQEATVKLQKLGIIIKDNINSFNSINLQYDTVKADYIRRKTDFESRVALLESRKNAYETDVANWNKHIYGPMEELERLSKERDLLNAEVDEINKLQYALNAEVDKINALANVLNRLAISLNIKTNEFNTLGKERGGEFEEGTYESDLDGEEINIYQFDDNGKLIRVLAHELGHALGLGHLDNPEAMMYRLNNGINAKLTEDDSVALKKWCGF